MKSKIKKIILTLFAASNLSCGALAHFRAWWYPDPNHPVNQESIPCASEVRARFRSQIAAGMYGHQPPERPESCAGSSHDEAHDQTAFAALRRAAHPFHDAESESSEPLNFQLSCGTALVLLNYFKHSNSLEFCSGLFSLHLGSVFAVLIIEMLYHHYYNYKNPENMPLKYICIRELLIITSLAVSNKYSLFLVLIDILFTLFCMWLNSEDKTEMLKKLSSNLMVIIVAMTLLLAVYIAGICLLPALYTALMWVLCTGWTIICVASSFAWSIICVASSFVWSIIYTCFNSYINPAVCFMSGQVKSLLLAMNVFVIDNMPILFIMGFLLLVRSYDFNGRHR